ncbi:MAG: DUF1360 domain-containing protein [Acidobacteriia bacterium]|nr:DUF1360 domain-containing protein [Terriglobia bacterium]
MLSTVSPIALVIATLAVWRVTHLFWGEDGPWDVFVRLRRLAGDSFFGSLLDCFYCLSLWIAAPPAWLLGHTWLERGFLWLALSGGAILLERISAERTDPENTGWQTKSTQTDAPPPPAVWHEEPLPPDQREEN